jgi:hypothetical protein
VPPDSGAKIEPSTGGAAKQFKPTERIRLRRLQGGWAKEPVHVAAPQTYFGKDDLVLKNSEGNKVEIYLGKQKAGRLIVGAKEGRFTADVQVNDDVDLEVRKKFH